MRAAAFELARIAPKVPWMERIEEHPSWETLAQLRTSIRAGVALNRFTVRDLLAMKEGQVFESLSSATEDVPVKIGQVQVGWSEFEVLEHTMALRLTRLG
ncbi:MAG: FliM/FliN family flagellar motor C-terminal domain-containing protein [Edaphobacter sp.]